MSLNLEGLDPGLTTSIDSLPYELFRKIFLPLAWADEGEPHHVTTISHVCHRWRSIALDIPCLWTQITIGDFDRAAEFLRRSQNALIYVGVNKDVPTDSILALAEMLYPHIHRFYSFRAILPSPDLATLITNLQSPAPNLADLGFAHFVDSPILPRPADVTVFPPAVFEGNTPVLRMLVISDMLMPLSWPQLCTYSCLRTIHLVYQPLFSSPTLEQLMEVLSQCSGLEILHMFRPFPHDFDPVMFVAPSRARKIPLPKLRRLSLLQAPRAIIRCILDHVSLPVSTIIEASVLMSHQHHTIQNVLPEDCSALAGLSGNRVLKYRRTNATDAFVQLHRDVESIKPPSLTLDMHETSPIVFFCCLPTMLDVSTIEFFVVTELGILHQLWAAVLRFMPSLRRVRVKLASIRMIVGALRLPAPDTAGNPTLPCPQLITLELQSLAFEPKLKEELLLCARARIEHGCGLQTLKLKNTGIVGVDELRELGIKVWTKDDGQ